MPLAAHHYALDHSLAAIEEWRLGFTRRLERSRFRSGYLRGGHLGPGLSSPLAEPLDLTAGVHDPLRAREERVADGADLGLELLARRPGRERVPAYAGDDRVFVIGGVNLCFQGLDSKKGSLPGQRSQQAADLKAGDSEVDHQHQPREAHRPART